MSALNCDTSTGTLTIDDDAGNPVSMHTGRWCITDLSDLWADEAVRGESKVMPYGLGRRPKRRRFDETRYLLPLVITGYVDENDQPCVNLDTWEQLDLNMDELRYKIVGPPLPTGDGTRTAVHTKPSGSVWTGQIHVLGFRKDEVGPLAIWRGHLEVVLSEPWVVT